jgi:N-methylhydantoinase B/oxoprolinase/acetone carboxylase alpha subunit
MLDDSCQMSHEDRKMFFFIYDAICDREDISLDDDVNSLIKLARNRNTIFSKPEHSSAIHACKTEVMQTTQKVHMKAFKKMVRENLDNE